jgi:hypothetical protein
LVRLPDFKELRCPRSVSKPCVLNGNNLFLANSIASTPDFDSPTQVPPEFTGTQLIVPHPSGGVLYLKLRDDPTTVQTLTLPVTPVSLPAEAAAIKAQPSTPQPTQPAPEPATSPSSGSSAPETAPAVPAGSTREAPHAMVAPGAPDEDQPASNAPSKKAPAATPAKPDDPK